MGEWPHGMCRKDFVFKEPELNLEKFKNESFSYIEDYSQYYGLSKDEWKSIIFDASTTQEIRKNMEIAFPDVELFCYRWNQASCYFYEWIRKGDDYLWVSMIRNPLDRATSSFQKHRWSVQDSLMNTLSFCEKIQSIKNNNRFHLIYYEKLAEFPEETIKKLYRFFNCEISKVNLKEVKGSNGQDFIPQSSTIQDVSTKKDGYLTQAEKYKGVYTKQINRHGFSKNDEVYQVFMNNLSEYEEYKDYF